MSANRSSLLVELAVYDTIPSWTSSTSSTSCGRGMSSPGRFNASPRCCLLRLLLLLLSHAQPACARRAVAALLNGKNCTQRFDSGECILNPYFMRSECEGLCESLTFVDALRDCESQLHMCYGRSRSGMLRRPEAFVRLLCNRTCREHFETIEYNMAPGNVTLLLL